MGTRRASTVGGHLVLVAVIPLMLAWTWRTWPDVLIDFGREVYVPWQLAAGEVLYRDIAHFSGPLSPYLNSLWFRAFGAHLDVLFAVNFVLLVSVGALLYHLLWKVSDRLSALTASFVFLALFAFGRYVMVGNYNYMAPYSHELTHGLLLSLAGIACLGTYAERRRAIWLWCAGLALGLTFLTKIEVFLAALLAFSAGFAVCVRDERTGRSHLFLHLALFTSAATLPAAAAYLLLQTAMPPADALHALLRQFLMAVDPELATSPFYAASMGTGDPAGNALRMVAWFGGYLLVFAPAFVIAVVVKPTFGYRRVVAAGLFAATAIALTLLLRGGLWRDALRPLPLILLLAAGVSTWHASRSPLREPQGRVTTRISLIVFAAALLAKIVLHARLHSYGFALAMPGTLLLVVILVGWVPALVHRLGGFGPAFRSAAAGALVAAFGGYLALMQAQLMEQSFVLVSDAGTIRTDSVRGPLVADLLALIAQHTESRQTLAVLPEGALVNFLARRTNSTPYSNFMPVELMAFDEEQILRAFQGAPPDMVVLVHKDLTEYGMRYFGADYGRALGDWLHARYERVAVVGEPPHDGSTQFGIELMRYRDPRSGERTIE